MSACRIFYTYFHTNLIQPSIKVFLQIFGLRTNWMILLQCGVHNNFIRWRSLSNAFKLISRYTIAPLYLELIMIAKSPKVVRLQCKIKALLQNFGHFSKVLPTFIFQAFIIFQKIFWEIKISFLDFCMRTVFYKTDQ